jgi:hypothetical protein
MLDLQALLAKGQDHKASIGSLNAEPALVVKGSNLVVNAARVVLEHVRVSLHRVVSQVLLPVVPLPQINQMENALFSSPLVAARMATDADFGTPIEQPGSGCLNLISHTQSLSLLSSELSDP